MKAAPKLFKRLLMQVMLCGALTSPFAHAEFVVLFLGDSLTEGYGLGQNESFPSLIEAKLVADNLSDIKIVNAGISGSTSASGLERLQWYIRSQPDLLFISLGANDGLRGLSTEEMSDNLSNTIEFAQEHGLTVVLAGMQIPPNYGPDYTKDFTQVFPTLAEKYQLDYLPFLLKDVAAVPTLNQADGIHPNVEGSKIVAETVYDFLKPLLPN